jgi:hypothetical protein
VDRNLKLYFLFQEFFGNDVTITWDGTYFYSGKSSAHVVNRSMYSGKKKRHLIKFMSLVLPDGYILETIGPFRGTMNDASIAENFLETNNELVEWCGGNGQMILDRGFRDVKKTFEKLGYEIRMPDFLQKGEKQHSTLASNTSRLCSKTRWIVESYQGQIHLSTPPPHFLI